MQFLEVSKKLSNDLTRVLHVLEKSYFDFALNVFLFSMKEHKGAILSQNHRRNQGDGPGARAPSIEMPPMTKILQKNLFLDF